MTSNLVIRSSLLLLIAATVVVRSTVTVSVRADQPGYLTIPTWPVFSMLYETPGFSYSRGEGESVTVREVHWLDYVSATQWTNTVVESPTITTAVGSHDRVGRYTRLSGTTYTEYDGAGAATHTETVEEDTTLIVGTMPAPFPIVESGIVTTSTDTVAKVCFLEECTVNADGVLYTMDKGSEFVFVDDARGIPLRVNESFVVKEITISDVKHPIVRLPDPTDPRQPETLTCDRVRVFFNQGVFTVF